MPRYYVSYDRTYVIDAEDEIQAMNIAETDGEEKDNE